jgi:hypothetical protein
MTDLDSVFDDAFRMHVGGWIETKCLRAGTRIPSRLVAGGGIDTGQPPDPGT